MNKLSCVHMRGTYLVGVTADRGDTVHSEVESLDREAVVLKERHDKAAQTAINVQPDVVLLCKLAQCDNVILATIREIDCRPYDLETS